MKVLRITSLFASVAVFAASGVFTVSDIATPALAMSSASSSALSTTTNNNNNTKPIPQSCLDDGADGSTAAPNPFPIYTADPVFVREVQNAKLFAAGAGNDTFHVLHLWGTAYEKGFAQGQIMKAEVAMVAGIIGPYIESQIQNYLPFIPASLIALVTEYGALPLLTLTYDLTRPFMRQEYVDEMNGIADGSGVDVKFIRMINMFPEATRASCTIVGATGPATVDKRLHQLRGLDIDPNLPIKDAPQVTVYHSSDPATTATFLTVGWTTMVGALTGFNEKGVGIGEKVWLSAPADADVVEGEPWMFVLRNVLELPTGTLNGALDSIEEANRTCAIHVGVGSAADNDFRGLEIAGKAFNVYNDTSINYPDGHPMIPGVVYWDKHKQPSKHMCLPDLLQQYAPQQELSAEVLAMQIAAISRTGNLHSVAFDYDAKMAFIANARKTDVTAGDLNAFNRQYTRIDMGKLFNLQQ